MAMADRSRRPLRKMSCGSATPCVFITEVPANGNGRQVMQHPLQSELQKRNALCVLITEVPVNGNGRQITWPPPQSVAVAERLICVNN